jgi:hypothetical protein
VSCSILYKVGISWAERGARPIQVDGRYVHILVRLLEGKVGSGKGQELEGRCAGCVVRTDGEGPYKIR